MGDVRGRALYQSFLPPQGHARALVWKFSLEFRGRRPRHFHAEPELNLIVSGMATFGVGEAVVTASKGDLLGFPPGQDHVLLETSPDLYLYAIGIDPRLSSEVLRSEAHRVAMPLHIRLLPGALTVTTSDARSGALTRIHPPFEFYEQPAGHGQ
jgi:mannose-6-phosphate isomerase-like protein (cupin superfamily)